ncbi:hypothetical protein BDR05DRAFT_992878 [Suillus weaverae]|nr:hypothetical protein BDR05DRAFT_992878 [Suillus weaverae]
MPAIREHDIYPNDVEDDDGMPPLVDNPNTSIVDPTALCENAWDNQASTSPVEFSDTPDYPAIQTVDRVSHGKKRDASYIPRPPNAFILFRSSFIRSQQVPEKVEGNHSTLSKIIGKYWKTLPREEREVWEAKALVAQAEHRKRYPDWRFRPGANALAKLKVKDGPGIANRRRSTQNTKKGRGNAESKRKNKNKDERCSMIADLLVEGKTGAELESALRNWENGISREVEVGKGAVGREGEHEHEGGDEGNWAEAFPTTNRLQMESVQFSQGLYHHGHVTQVNTDGHDHPATSQPRCKTPHDDRFNVPLTAMFKRSLSAPARRFASPANDLGHSRNNSLTKKTGRQEWSDGTMKFIKRYLKPWPPQEFGFLEQSSYVDERNGPLQFWEHPSTTVDASFIMYLIPSSQRPSLNEFRLRLAFDLANLSCLCFHNTLFPHDGLI